MTTSRYNIADLPTLAAAHAIIEGAGVATDRHFDKNALYSVVYSNGTRRVVLTGYVKEPGVVLRTMFDVWGDGDPSSSYGTDPETVAFYTIAYLNGDLR